MVTIEPFEHHWDRYEQWFEQNEAAYVSELLAVRALVPWTGLGLEIGVGTGRFAAPLGIEVGVDPSPAMLRIARERGVAAIRAMGETLPLPTSTFDHVLVVTTLCFLGSPARMLAEAHRVLKPGGVLAVGFIDRDSALGQQYVDHQSESEFYRDARFYSTGEVESLLLAAGFRIRGWGQTLSSASASSAAAMGAIEPVRPGRGSGAFVVVAAVRNEDASLVDG